MGIVLFLVLIATTIPQGARGEYKKSVAIIIAEGRSGSTTLMSLLASHPDAFVIAEPFFNYQGKTSIAPRFRDLVD